MMTPCETADEELDCDCPCSEGHFDDTPIDISKLPPYLQKISAEIYERTLDDVLNPKSFNPPGIEYWLTK
jgi:hypothetical protein